jgi:hypothetical protein
VDSAPPVSADWPREKALPLRVVRRVADEL